jgi:hypothetical protein
MTENTTPTATQNVGGYEVPVDPMDLLQCDSCQ